MIEKEKEKIKEGASCDQTPFDVAAEWERAQPPTTASSCWSNQPPGTVNFPPITVSQIKEGCLIGRVVTPCAAEGPELISWAIDPGSRHHPRAGERRTRCQAKSQSWVLLQMAFPGEWGAGGWPGAPVGGSSSICPSPPAQEGLTHLLSQPWQEPPGRLMFSN